MILYERDLGLSVTSRLCLRSLCLFIGLASTWFAIAQGVTPSDWTSQERQFVDEMRGLYVKQGLPLSDEQAQAAVRQMRERQKATRKGIPSSEWTSQEALQMSNFRDIFAKQGQPFTDEQAALAVQSMREQVARISGGIAALQTLANQRMPVQTTNMQVASPPVPAMGFAGSNQTGEDQLATQIARLPPKTGDLSVKQRREGFEVNGQPVLDAEGRIAMYSYDVVSGDITYAVETPTNTVIKIMRAGSPMPSITIATAVKGEAGWSVQTVTGQRLAGPALSMMPRGLLVARPGAAFRYVPGQGVRNIAVPSGYVLTPIQRGNVGATGYLLLERENASGGGSELGQLFSSIKALGAGLGINKKEDYALYNIDTGATFLLNIGTEGRNVTVLSDCYRRKPNSIINECYRSQSFESLYDKTGERNTWHYYWRVHWLNTPQGPIAITMENGSKDIFIMDLTTGKKVVAFHRTLGINELDVTQKPAGAVQIDARLAFDRQSIPDASAFLAANPPVGLETALAPEK